MISRKVTVGSSGGLHARTAGMIAQAAGKQPVLVMVRVGDGRAVQARSLLSLLSLGAVRGTELTLEADGDHAAESLDAVAALLASDLDAVAPSDA
jgi:phosphocarrier protein HPr